MCGKTQQTQQSGTSTTAAPGYVTDAGKAVAKAADSALTTPVTPYTAPLTAGTTPDQQSAFQDVRNTVNDTPTSVPGVAADINNYAAAPAQNVSVGTSVDQTGPLGSIASYMDPNVSATLVPAIRAIQEQADAQRKQIGATATMSGAFGDARQGVDESMLNRNEDTSIGDTTAQANEAAYQQAMANRQTDLSRINQQDNTNAGYNETALNRQLGGANALESTASTDQSNLLTRLNALLNAGTVQQQTTQAGDTSAYTEFLRQMGYSDQQLAAASNALSSVSGSAPKTTTTTGTTTSPDNSLFQLAGSGLGALGSFGGSAAGSAALAALI